MYSDDLITSNTLQLGLKGSKDNKKKCIVIREEFFQLYNNKSYIKRILYNYFIESEYFINSNIDVDFCCSCYNSFLKLKVLEYTIYKKRGVVFNI